MGRRKIVRSILKFTNRSSGTKWWLKDESLVPIASSIAKTIADITNNVVPSSIEMLKLNERKAVFRLEHPQNAGRSFVAKAFLLNRFGRRLKYCRYGLDEAANLIVGRDRGVVCTPEVYGYGHVNGILGIPKANAVVLEDLRGFSPISALIYTRSEAERCAIFMQTVPLFVSLYNAGCNHIDVNAGAVMFCGGNSNHTVFLLDFQHAKFYNKPSTEILMFEAGYFARCCSAWVSTKTINEWLNGLFAAIGYCNTLAEMKKMTERFDYYFDTGIYLSRKERRKIH